MSSDDTKNKNLPATLESETSASRRESHPSFDPARHMAPTVAHELNNMLTVVQGYADRLLLHHGKDPKLRPQLKLISEAARRAAVAVRNATPPKANELQNSRPAQVA